MIEPPGSMSAGPPDPEDAATDAMLRHWADTVVPLPPPPYGFQRVLVRAHRRKLRRRMLAVTASALSFALLFAGLAAGNLLPGLRSTGGNCGNATYTVAAAKGSNPMVSRKTEYVIGGVLAAAALTAGVVAGCNGGSSGAAPSDSSTGSGIPNATATSGGSVVLPSASSVVSTPAGQPTGNSSTVAGVPQCHTVNLSAAVSVVAGSQAAGHESLNITLTNTSGHSCTIYGFPGLGLEDKNGSIQASKVTWNPAVAKKIITLADNGTASTTAGFDPDIPASGEPASGPCEIASYSMMVTPPNEQTQLVAPITGATGGITVCGYGALQVFALVAGSTGPNQ